MNARAIRIQHEAVNQPDVVALIDALDDYQKPLYPATSFHGIDIDALLAPNVIFAVARSEQAAAVGCGAVVMHEDYGELKRMYVVPGSRGQGIGAAILEFLEADALARHCRLLRLETGVLQAEALRLYERRGYVQRGPFGDYLDDPHSLFFEKRILEP